VGVARGEAALRRDEGEALRGAEDLGVAAGLSMLSSERVLRSMDGEPDSIEERLAEGEADGEAAAAPLVALGATGLGMLLGATDGMAARTGVAAEAVLTDAVLLLVRVGRRTLSCGDWL
jgi:hypothetical protein